MPFNPEDAYVTTTYAEGLPQNSIKDILPSRDGYLWIATQEGLARFDGLKFTEYTTRNAPGLFSNNIHMILEDGRGDLWMLTGSGITRYHGGIFQTMTLKSDGTDSRIDYIFKGKDGNIYAASDTGILRGDDRRLTPIASTKGFLTNGPWYFAQQSNGTVWMSGAGRHMVSVQGGRVRRYIVPGKGGDEIGGIAVDRRGTVWIAADGLWRVDSAGNLAHVAVKPIASGQHVDALACGPDGRLRFILQGSLYTVAPGQSSARFLATPSIEARWCAFDPDGTAWQLLPNHGHDIIWCYDKGRVTLFPVNGQVTTEWTLPVHRGAEGTVWVGTYTGLVEYKRGRCQTYGREVGLPTGDVRAAYRTSDGLIWLDDSSTTLGVLGNNRFVPCGDPNLRPGDVASMAEDGDGALWVSTYTGHLWRVERSRSPAGEPADRFGRKPAVEYRALLGDITSAQAIALKNTYPVAGHPSVVVPVTALARGIDGSLWCSAGNRLIQFVHGRRVAVYAFSADSPLNDHVYVITPTRDGRIWVGGEMGFAYLDHGVFRYFGAESGIPTDAVIDIREDHAGEVWIAFWGSGLGRYRNGKIDVVTLRDGLYSDSIQSVLEGSHNDLWIGTSHGIFSVNRTDLNHYIDSGRGGASFRCRAYGSEEGELSMQYAAGRQPVAFRSPDGALWFASLAGLVRVSPADPPLNRVGPLPVVIEKSVIGGVSYPTQAFATAPPGAGDLEFDYTAITFRQAAKVTFRYRLDGFDRGWVDAADRRVAYYTHVPPGNYRFQVIACDADGNCNLNGAAFDFAIKPHYYETTWFRVLLAIAAMLVAFGIGIGWSYRLRRQNRQLEERVDQRTRDLALANRDLRDSREEVLAQNTMLQQIQAELEAQNQELVDSRALLAEQNEQLHEMQLVLKIKNESLMEANTRLEDLATIDGLTGLKNHRSFQVKLDSELKFAARHNTPLSIIILDVDSFKSFNDTYGHPAGDEVLKQVARILSDAARDSDFVARYGGEEFVVIMPITDREGAAGLAERLRRAIETWPWTVRQITASFGVATLTLDIHGAADFVDRADKALYSSKQAGKNCVRSFSAEMAFR